MLRALVLFAGLFGGAGAGAEPLRLALFNSELDREGPGLLLRDIARGAADVATAQARIRAADPDLLVLLRFDYDCELAALRAFNAGLGARAFPYLFALRPNTGWATGRDLNRNGRLGEPEDAQSFGAFAGQNGMAVLSRRPVLSDGARDFSGLLWRDLPDPGLPETETGPFWGAGVLEQLRLSTVGHWDLPLDLGAGRRLHLLIWHGSPPVFDGPEDRNGRRGAAEARFWRLYLDGALERAPPAAPVVVIGSSNIDPGAGEGHRAEMAALLAHPRLQDPRPRGARGTRGAAAGRPLATADWRSTGAGLLRVGYILPDRALEVAGAGVAWGAPEAASRHGLVWVDLALE